MGFPRCGVSKTMKLIGALLGIMMLIAASAASEEPKTQKNKSEASKQLTLPTIQKFRARPSLKPYNEIIRNFSKSRDFREETSKRLFAIRATTPPPPPFSPKIPKVEHGVAIEISSIMGYTWTTSAVLVEGAATVEIRDREGTWHLVKSRKKCPKAKLAVLENLPVSITSSPANSANRAFEIINPEVLEEELPVLAVTDIEGPNPTLHLGILKQRLQAAIGESWEHDLITAQGTPLLDHKGRVVLIQTSPSRRKIATAPLDGFRCPPEEAEAEQDE